MTITDVYIYSVCIYIYIFLSCVKCCIEAVHFFCMGQHIFYVTVKTKMHIFVLHVITILYAQFLFSSEEDNKMLVM